MISNLPVPGERIVGQCGSRRDHRAHSPRPAPLFRLAEAKLRGVVLDEHASGSSSALRCLGGVSVEDNPVEALEAQ
jgi:hypothetical protein